jgi:FlaA1/EpsC-like NDP-sugar epimerase
MYFIIHYNANCFYPLQCKSKPLKLLLQISGGAILAVLKYKILISLYNTIWKHLFCIHVLYCIVLRFHVVLCCVVLCCVVLCCVVLCCVVLCCIMLWCVVLSFSNYVSVMWSPLSPYCIVSKQIKPNTYS